MIPDAGNTEKADVSLDISEKVLSVIFSFSAKP
jgi:hypothetical protein